MEVMFYIIAGKFNPSNDDFPVKTLITKDKFADKYAQDCTNLLDQQDIFKTIDKIEPAITNGIECVQPRKDVGFNGFVVEDVICTGYWFWIDADTVTLSEGDCACSTGGAWFTLDITITSELDEYDIKNYVYETCKRLLDKFVEIGNCHRAHVSRDERFAFEITENQC